MDLQAQLQDRGMTAQEAAAYLDNSPDITFSVWCVSAGISFKHNHSAVQSLQRSAAHRAPGRHCARY